MAAITNIELWSKGERDCFQYLLDATNAEENKNAFLGAMPKTVYNAFVFDVSGGDVPLDYDFNMGTPGGCGDWHMYAMVTGLFQVRADAQRLAGLIRASLPAAENFTENVYRFRPRSEPRLLADSLDQTKAIVWLLEYDLEVILKQE